jgi:hypothetical protein
MTGWWGKQTLGARRCRQCNGASPAGSSKAGSVRVRGDDGVIALGRVNEAVFEAVQYCVHHAPKLWIFKQRTHCTGLSMQAVCGERWCEREAQVVFWCIW